MDTKVSMLSYISHPFKYFKSQIAVIYLLSFLRYILIVGVAARIFPEWDIIMTYSLLRIKRIKNHAKYEHRIRESNVNTGLWSI